MSTAALVPETWELDGDDAVETIRSCGRKRLVTDAVQRLRVADGFTHARSLGFLASLVAIQGLIALTGLAKLLGEGAVAEAIASSMETIAPGPAGQVLSDAMDQAGSSGSGAYVAVGLGVVGAMFTATTAMGQIERAMNRIYGIEQDRPTAQKYLRAFLLALTGGLLAVLSFTITAFGRSITDAAGNNIWADLWRMFRWPAALLLMVASVTVLFRWAPRRHQPQLTWLMFGAAVAVALWMLVTTALGLFFRTSDTFGDTYGPLAGIVALFFWSLLSSVAILFGAAVTAQLEAVRARAIEPQDPVKVDLSEPDARRVPQGRYA
jgi:YihY family inner membrane protein